MTESLFPDVSAPSGAPDASASGEARVQRPERGQLEWRAVDLEGLLPAHHRARVVWEFVEGLDLRAFYAPIKAVEGQAGRPAIAPEILVALWLYATLESVGSARAVARLCEAHDAYRWLCGGVGVNYHTLADFRVAHGAAVDGLLTQSVAALMTAGHVRLERVAQDGVRVRAAASSKSFRRRARVESALATAEAQVQALRQELLDDPAATTRRQAAARERAARERQQRVQAALAALPALEAQAARRAAREGGRGKEPRVSTTDAEARVMKQPDGGYRPAYNVQFAADTGPSQAIVGVDVTAAGTDVGLAAPMVAQVERRYGRPPGALLLDGGYISHDDFEYVEGTRHCTIYAPVPALRGEGLRRQPRESAVLTAWRGRMATLEAQTIYKQRAATAECVNAQARQRGLRQVVVRGLVKVRAVAGWYALAHNLVRTFALQQRAAEQYA